MARTRFRTRTRTRVPMLAAAALLAAGLGAPAPRPAEARTLAEATVDDYAPHEILVAYREGVGPHRRAASLGPVAGTVEESRPRLGYHRVRLPEGVPVKDAVERLARDPDVAWAEPNYYAHTFGFPFCPQDPFLADDGDSTNQWGVFQTNLYSLWKQGYGGGLPNVKIAIVDSGIDSWTTPHPDLVPNLDSLGYDAVDGDSVPVDVGANKGHGTAVAGVAAAAADTNGIAGVAYCSTIQVVRVMDCSAPTTCTGTVDDIVEGIEWAALNGADVMNLSLGVSFYSQALRNAVLDAIEQNVIVVAATGNDGAPTIAFPADFPEVIAVGASDSTGGVWSGSNYGPNLDVVAPGEDIMAPDAVGTYKTRTGTSLAAPYVTGIAALLVAKNPAITHLEAKEWLNAHTRPTSDPTKDGSGEIFFGGLADFSDGQGVPVVAHQNSLWEWLGTDVTPEASDADPMDFDGRPNIDGFDPGHGDGGDDGVFPMSLPRFPYTPDRWSPGEVADVQMTVSRRDGGRYGPAADRMIYVDQFIDWNVDGVFEMSPSAEHTIVAHAEDPSTWAGDQLVATLPITAPTTHFLGLPLTIRTRLAYGAAAGVAADVPYGEVEDFTLDHVVEDFDTMFYVAPALAPFPMMSTWAVVPDPDPITGAANNFAWEWAAAPHPHPGDECNGAIETIDAMGFLPMVWPEYTAGVINFHYDHNSQQCGPADLDACRMAVFRGGGEVFSVPIPLGSGDLTVDLAAFTGPGVPFDIAFIAETDNQGWLYIDDISIVAFDEGAPAAIGDLALARPAGSKEITASWTSVHENAGFAGTEDVADSYQVRYSDMPITSNLDFFNAVPVLPTDLVGAMPLPAAPGTPQSVTFAVPSAFQSYHVAVRTQDEVVHDTMVSNAPLDIPAPTAGVTVVSTLGNITVNAAPGDSVDVSFQVTNTGNVDDLFLLESSGLNHAWTGGYVDENGIDRTAPIGITLAPGAMSTLTFGIPVPAAAADSTVEVLEARATSVNGAVADTDTITIVVQAGGAVDSPVVTGIPSTASLGFAGPNPSRGATAFRLALTREQAVRVELFDIAGRRVKLLEDGVREAGVHDIAWDGTVDLGREAASGIYFLRAHGEEIAATKQVVRLR